MSLYLLYVITLFNHGWKFSFIVINESVRYEDSNQKYECSSYLPYEDVKTECNTDEECLKIGKFHCDNNDDCFGFSWSSEENKIKFCKDLNMKERKEDSSFKSRMKFSKRNSITYMYLPFFQSN